ncbi:hypothetical protein AMAG_04651 [Allomyces macrogynus ATCC 38327]|uniref:Uncharacterized protein n=1 Tax=Allomyces macrogynus (strain ATCC 38327) TaxID=578462 RepID=A0A0L0S608_ALLM3|nr:hypothetical protein AMAG_04651 [Allomyces macrogynus ATCC 38327]|eukprot:KNE57804.1 hypothetical protein AMAG_04651 [Allomyces macrogynus ATCC 38327]
MADPVEVTLVLRYQGGPGRPGRLMPPTLRAAGHDDTFVDLTDPVAADPLLARCSPRTRAAARFFAAAYTMAASWMAPPQARIDAMTAANLVAGPFPNGVRITPELLMAALRFYCTPVAVRPLPDRRWIMAFLTHDDANYVLYACDRQLAVGDNVVVLLRAATDQDLALLGSRAAPAIPAPLAVSDAQDEVAAVLDTAANADFNMDVVPEPAAVEPPVDANMDVLRRRPTTTSSRTITPPINPPLHLPLLLPNLRPTNSSPPPDPPDAHSVSILGHPPIGPFIAAWKRESPPASVPGWMSHSDPQPPPPTTAAAAAPSPAASTHTSLAPPPLPSSFVAEPSSPWNDPIKKAPLTGWGAAGWSDGSSRGTWERVDRSTTSAPASSSSSSSSSSSKVGVTAAPARQWTTPPPVRDGPRAAGGWTREPPPPADGTDGHGGRWDIGVPSNGGDSSAPGTKRARARTPSAPAPPPPEPPRKRVARCVAPPPSRPPSPGRSSRSASVSPPPEIVPTRNATADAAAALADNATCATSAAAAVPVPPSMSPSPVVVAAPPPPPPPTGRGGNNVIDLDNEEEASNGGAPAAPAATATSPPRRPNDRSHRPPAARASASAAGSGNVIDLSDSDDDFAPGPSSRSTAATTTTKAPPPARAAPPDPVPVVKRTVILTISRGATTAMVRKAIAAQWDEPGARVHRGDQVDADHVEYTIVLQKPWSARLQTTLNIAEQRWNVRSALPPVAAPDRRASNDRDQSRSRESRNTYASSSSSFGARAAAKSSA